MKKYAIPPEGFYPYLTPGKRYEVLNERNEMFDVVDDGGVILRCCLNPPMECAHINGQQWKIEEEQEAKP